MRVYIGCSDKDSVAIKYRDLAVEVATIVAKRGHKLIIDGKDTGMMGKCYMTFKYEDNRIKAILDVKDTDNLHNLELDAYEVMTSTFKRTESIYKSSQIIIFLPGGIQTISEFLAMIEEERKHHYGIPIILYNYDYFYDDLIKQLKDTYKEQFIDKEELKLFEIVTNSKSLALYLDAIEKKEEEFND